MKEKTRQLKKSMAGFRQIADEQLKRQWMHRIVQRGTEAVDQISLDVGRMLVEFILYCEREQIAGPD